MLRKSTLLTGILNVYLLVAILPGIAWSEISKSDEKAVWDVWKIHQTQSNRHDTVVAAGRKISSTNELIGVSQGLAAWHLLQMGNTNAATAILETMASTGGKTPLATAVGEMARRWLTRLDLEKVKRGLQIVYRRDIKYPPSLNTLKKLPRELLLPLQDRWNVAWQYKATGYNKIPGLDGQSYQLSCKKLGADSDLAEALACSYGVRITLRPIAIATTSRGNQTVKFKNTDGKAETTLLSEGAQYNGITFAYGGLKLIMLTDGDHWLVLPQPKP